MDQPTNTPTHYIRSTSDHVAFWVLWVLFLIPVIFLLMMTIGGGVSIILLPLLAQLAIHGIALKWFLDSSKPVSKSLLMLLGGTGALYFLILGGCVVMLMGLSGASFH